jgi:hypothetical protein
MKEKGKREKWVGAKKDECTNSNSTSAWEFIRKTRIVFVFWDLLSALS